MKNHNGFRRFICVTVLCALLMVSMGRATRVSAVGTSAAIAGTAFILTGAVYLSYVVLTQGEMVLPAAEEMHNWLGGIGKKVSQYPSGAAAYQDIYQGLLRDPTANVIDGVWTWTQDRIKSFVNDFSDTRIISDILSYDELLDVVQPYNGFTYNLVFLAPAPVVGYNQQPLALYGPLSPIGSNMMITEGVTGAATIQPIDISYELRNFKDLNGSYYIQYLSDIGWVNYNQAIHYGYRGSSQYLFSSAESLDFAQYFATYSEPSVTYGAHDYPLLPYKPIYDAQTGEYVEMDEPVVVRNNLPSWVDPDNENRPIVPWVPIPDIPTGVPVPPGYTGSPQWGFPLQDLLDLLEELARGLINIGAIGELINQFAGQHGDNYYLEYNDGDTYYYTYYQPTIFDNDTQYITYNIDISEQEEVIPVDLNTISLYTKNEYLDAVKQSARHFGDAIGEYVAFWHNSDYTLTYTILGGFVLILIGAFIGKWGHS